MFTEESSQAILTVEPADVPPATTIVFGPNDSAVYLDTLTGNVTFSEGLDPDEASRQFWEILKVVVLECPCKIDCNDRSNL